MAIIIKNNTNTALTIVDLSITLLPLEVKNITVYKQYDVTKSNDLIRLISSNKIIVNDGDSDLTPSDGLKHCIGNSLSAATDRASSKLRVHQTSRQPYMKTCFTGVGDDPNDVYDIGHGTKFGYRHKLGDDPTIESEVVFNTIDNETWVHEVYIGWRNCEFDMISLDVIPTITNTEPGTYTDYTVYEGVILPAAGDGDIKIVSDLTEPYGGLCRNTPNEFGEWPRGAWDADWNSTTQKFENILPNTEGTGEYNLFTDSSSHGLFVNQIQLLGDGFERLQTSDIDQVGHGWKFNLIYETDLSDGDHDWDVSLVVTLHRKRIYKS